MIIQEPKTILFSFDLDLLHLSHGESLLAFSQVHAPLWCREIDTISTRCSISEASALYILLLTFPKKQGGRAESLGLTFAGNSQT